MKHAPLIFAVLTAILLAACLVEYGVHAFDVRASHSLMSNIGFWLMFPGAELGVLIEILLRYPHNPNPILSLLVFYIFPFLTVALLSFAVFGTTRAAMHVLWPSNALQRT